MSKKNQIRNFRDTFKLTNEFVASFMKPLKEKYAIKMIYDKHFNRDEMVVELCKKYQEWLCNRQDKVNEYLSKLEEKLKKHNNGG